MPLPLVLEGVKGPIPGFSIADEENDDVLIKEDMFVEHVCDRIQEET
jgi:hypothetical protein